jgi:DNA topoisomerase IA
MPDFPEPLETGYGDECNPLVYRKTWWIQTSTVCGTVQTPTLAMVVDRFAAIENFKPQPYWELQTLYRDILLVMKKAVF